jgi:L-fucose dehydrogenase
MNLHLANKVALVTGGANGIGEAAVRSLTAEGCRVALVDRNHEAGEKLADELSRQDHHVIFVNADLSKSNACKEVVEEVTERLGPVDILVNNAGVNDGVGFEASRDELVASLERNLFHYFEMVRECAPQLRKRKGRIINIASKVAVTGQGGTAGYAAAKGAILALTREWALEFAKSEVTVNAIAPAEVDTPQYQEWLASRENPKEDLQRIVDRIPLGARMTTADEIASMITFLASEKAAHITGQHLFVDGGYVHLDRAYEARA